jgi:choline dehydrogenase-like flavoprotein
MGNGDTISQNNRKSISQNTYDAIVIGSGISGGWAAKELCENGLKTLVLERGRMVKHLTDYPTATKNPWDFANHGRLSETFRDENPIVSKCYALDEATQHFFVKDKEHPYIQEKPFDWIRGYQVGGKSLIWARQTQRWSDYEFNAPARDGFAVDWPIRYKDLAPWYSYVEKFAGISGNADGIDHLPDGEFLPPFELNCVEKHIQQTVSTQYTDRQVIIGRCAHLTKPAPIHLEQGRGQCQARNLCYRGCPFGGYYNSNSTTLPWADRTGNLTLRPHSVVHSIIYDPGRNRATGVRVIDAETRQVQEFFARVIFVNAACLNTNLLMLNSISSRFPNGFGNDNGLLGRYLAFHLYRGSAGAGIEGFTDGYYYGRRPTAGFMPAFRNIKKQQMDFLRGYMLTFSASRAGWQQGLEEEGIGAEWKEKMSYPGEWQISVGMQGETLPKYENHVRLSKDHTDEWGIPQLITSIGYDENDEKMLKDVLVQQSEILEKAGCKNIYTNDNRQAPGLDIHEMGGVRMGKDPKTSLLNEWNQFHACKNVFVTDGACMTSTGNQNPSLTFMALTARAANHAVSELKKQNL